MRTLPDPLADTIVAPGPAARVARSAGAEIADHRTTTTSAASALATRVADVQSLLEASTRCIAQPDVSDTQCATTWWQRAQPAVTELLPAPADRTRQRKRRTRRRRWALAASGLGVAVIASSIVWYVATDALQRATWQEARAGTAVDTPKTLAGVLSQATDPERPVAFKPGERARLEREAVAALMRGDQRLAQGHYAQLAATGDEAFTRLARLLESRP